MISIEDPCLSVLFIQQLYRSWMGYAERLSSEQLEALHIETELDQAVAKALQSGIDVILTGNPGDGKTHLMKRLMASYAAELKNVNWIVDATAVEPDGTASTGEQMVFMSWKAARKKHRPTCLAINQGVLREMLRQVDGDPLSKEVRRQLDEAIWYFPKEPSGPRESVLVIDLDRRSPLAPDFVMQVVKVLIGDKFYPECSVCPIRETCQVPANRRRLNSPAVQHRVAKVLELVGKSGFHATVRDLLGLIAFMITAGKSCAEHMRAKSTEGLSCYDLMFAAQGALGAAIRGTFDPGHSTNPLLDEEIWTGVFDGNEWEEANGYREPPAMLAESRDADRRMTSLRRLYFFEFLPEASEEHYMWTQLPPADREFYAALEGAQGRSVDTSRKLVALINGFFSRVATTTELRVWVRHHFDVPPSPIYLSTRGLATRHVVAVTPHPSTWQKHALPFQIDHLFVYALSPSNRAPIARLRIDRDTYRGLFEAMEGQPFALRRSDLTRALEGFLSTLGAAISERLDVEEVMVESFKTGRSTRFSVSRESNSYSG